MPSKIAYFRSLQRLTAVAILLVSSRLAYSLVLDHLWFTLAVVGVKTCLAVALLMLLDRSDRLSRPNLSAAPSSVLILLLMFGSMTADFAVATVIH